MKQAGIIAIWDNRVLIVYSKNHFGFPKGYIKENESTWECARRETWEETGVKFNTYEKTYIIEGIIFYIVLVDSFRAKQIDIKSKMEIAEVKILSLHNLASMLHNPNVKHLLNRSLRLYLRSHPVKTDYVT